VEKGSLRFYELVGARGMRIKSLSLLLIISFAFAQLASGADIPSDAEKHMMRGEAAVEIAQDESDYKAAIKEFEKATELAPDWANAHYNLAIAQEGAGQYQQAIQNMKRYLELSPDAPDAKEVQKKIFKLEYKMEKAARPSTGDLAGNWIGTVQEPNKDYYKSTGNDIYRIEVDGDNLRIFLTAIDGVKPYSFFGNFKRNFTGEMLFRLRVDDYRISGVYIQPYINQWTPIKEFPVYGTVYSDKSTIVLNFSYSYNYMVDGSDDMYTYSSNPAILTITRYR